MHRIGGMHGATHLAPRCGIEAREERIRAFDARVDMGEMQARRMRECEHIHLAAADDAEFVAIVPRDGASSGAITGTRRMADSTLVRNTRSNSASDGGCRTVLARGP